MPPPAPKPPCSSHSPRPPASRTSRACRSPCPPGLLAKLKGVETCPEQLAGSGACPAASQVGRLALATGPAPLWIPQPGKEPTAIYLAGPYRDAPLSLLVSVPAQAGPFDLGRVLSRAAVRVDPGSTQVSAVSDPLPQILEGVPITYRDLRIEIDRPGFPLNPTGCVPTAVAATASSQEGATAGLSAPFGLTGCGHLAFGPKLSLRLAGETRRTDHPSLRALLRARPGEAGIAAATVTLPHSAFLDQVHIRAVCTRVQFAARRCPKGSAYGHATLRTPLLDEPLRGPVYLRSSDHPLPDLVADLRGQIEIELAGRISSSHGAIRTTFASLPDAPFSSFALRLKGGKRGLIVNSTDLCRGKPRARVHLAAHNGRRSHQRPPVGVGCGTGTHGRG
jgi:hypothetical protein